MKLLEGYGLTEAVTGIMATPLTEYREGSVVVAGLEDRLGERRLPQPLGQTHDCLRSSRRHAAGT